MNLSRILAALLASLPLAAYGATCTHEDTAANSGNSPGSSNAFTPAADSLLVVFVGAGATVDDTATLSNSESLTFDQVAVAQQAGNAARLYAYVAESLATAVSQTVTWTHSSDTANNTIIVVCAVDGMTLLGAESVRQAKVRENVTTATDDTPDVTFDAAALTDNIIFGAVYTSTNPAALTEPADMTEGADTGIETKGLQYSYQNSGFTGTNKAWGVSASAWGAILLELDTSGAGGVFTVNPTVTAQDTNDYTLSGTTDASATVSAVACIKDTTAPTIAQVVAGDCTGDVNAEAATTDTWDGADSLTLGGALTLKVYDLYATDGATRVDLTDEQLDPAAGYERTILTSVDSTSPYFGTETATGDYCDTEAVTSPDSYVVTPAVDGTIEYAAGGDPSRQIILGDCHDLSESDIDEYQFVFNNLTCGLEDTILSTDPILHQKDVATTAEDIEVACVDPEGDDVDVAVDALPTGLSLVDTPPFQVTGTPTVCQNVTSEFTFTDDYGAEYVESQVYQIGDLVPDVVGDDEATAIAAIEAVCNFTAVAGAPRNHASVPVGDVISTDPVSGWLSPSGEEITYVLSLGPSEGSQTKGLDSSLKARKAPQGMRIIN